MEQAFEFKGLKAAILTDREGVVILKSNNQASKLGLKQNNMIVSMYDLYQIIQLDQNPLIITIISDATSNTGIFMHLARQLKDMTEPVVNTMQSGGHIISTHQE
ncbi:unnamed protein product [Cunninghamella echinulata]